MARSTPARVSGRLQVHRDGYGFLIPGQSLPWLDGDIFVPPDGLGGGMHGDRAMVKLTRISREGRAEGEVVKIQERANRTIVGTFRVTQRKHFVEPADGRIGEWIEIQPGFAIPPAGAGDDRIGTHPVTVSDLDDLDGMVVDVEIIDFANRDRPPRGRVIEILGRPDDFGVDVEVIIRKHRIPHRFSAEVLEQALKVPSVVRDADLQGRRDFRDLGIVTIDGETARDFDDAVWVDRLDNGNYALHVHIADVSHYVQLGSYIDQEAELRGNSVYFPDRAVPMLPLELSTGTCSLNPKVDRLTMSALLEIDHHGTVVSQEFVRGVIRSAERMTYTNVHALLEGDERLRERYAPLVERFELMAELAQVLNRMRTRRGSIDFDLPEPLIEFDEFGAMVGVGRSPRNLAHRLIEEFMLVANEAVASHLEAVAESMIFRIHELPDPKRVMEFEEIASHFGVSLGVPGLNAKNFHQTPRRQGGRGTRKDAVVPVDEIKVTPRHYQRLIKKIEGKPEERVLSYLMLRSLRQARYSEENRGHFALAARTYTHFTSPIRRYPDLVVHRVLAALMDGEKSGYTPAKLHALGDHCSDAERRAAGAERELVDWKKIDFMAGRVGDEFPALIINTASFGFFVELDELFIEGLVPVDSLAGEPWGYNESSRKIVAARSGRSFSIGDRLRVRLDRVDAIGRKLAFSVAGLARPGKSRQR